MSKKQRNVLWLFVLAFIVAESLLFLVGIMSFQSKRNHILKEHTNNLQVSYESIFNTYSLVSDVIFEQIINTQEITELFSRAYKNSDKRQSEIRDSLFQILNPSYIGLSSQSIKQLHFHLPNNVSFLRFRRPQKFGDDLSDVRESVRLANANQAYKQGFEEGKVYNGFRFVYPMSYNNKHIGTVETSISFGAINQMLHKQADNVYSFIIRKSVVDDKVFKDEKHNYVTSAISTDWVEEKEYLHYNYSCKDLPQEILKKLDYKIKSKYQNKLEEGLPFSVYIRLDERKYIVSFVPVYNIKKEHVAYIMSYLLDVYSDTCVSRLITFIGGGSLLMIIIVILFYIIYIKNITIEDQHSALLMSEARYKHIYDTVDIGIITNSLDGKIVMANPKLLDVLGYTSLKKLKMHNITDFYVDPELRQKFVDKLVLEEYKQVSGEALWKKKDGREILIRFFSKKHKDSAGFTYIESVIQDITELRELEESLRFSEAGLQESNAAKDRFFSILAHDLRGPFNSLLGLTEIIALQPETLDDKRKTRFIHLIHKGVKNLSSLIENLLEWSRSQQGTIGFNPKEIKLEPLVQETANLLSEVGFSKEIALLVNIDKNIKILADEDMVKTIFRNLISNAIKYTHKEGLIKIYSRDLRPDKSFIEISVEDNGVGIAKEDLNKLFKIDSAYSNPGTEKEKGTGLGLVLVKEFLEKHQGTIHIESEKGIGTKVIFTLPTVP